MTALPPITDAPAPTTTTVPLDTEPPQIESSIESGDVVDWYRGVLTVVTEADAKLTVNGEDADLDLGGSVFVPIVNAPGDNTVVITATDAEGNTAERSITYEFAAPEGWIATIGDSIMLGTKDEIEKRLGEGIVDATVSRQFNEAPALVSDLGRRPTPPQAIVIGLGTNGPVQARDFDKVMETVDPDTLVAFINVSVPRDWEATSNTEIAQGVARYENAILIDWFSVADGRSDVKAGDGFHPSATGRVILADLIAEAIIPGWESVEG